MFNTDEDTHEVSHFLGAHPVGERSDGEDIRRLEDSREILHARELATSTSLCDGKKPALGERPVDERAHGGVPQRRERSWATPR